MAVIFQKVAGIGDKWRVLGEALAVAVLTSSILVATWQNENKFSSALAAPRIRLIRLIRGQKKDILGQK